MKKNFFRSLFSNERKIIKSIRPRIDDLEAKIKAVKVKNEKRESVEALIELFKVISPIQDAGGFNKEIEYLEKYGKNQKVLVALVALRTHFHKAGRDRYGMNRTEVDEEVTSEKIFLGNIFGLWTRRASYFLAEKKELEASFCFEASTQDKPVSYWEIINDYQCGKFVKSHTDGILKQIAVLKVAWLF